MTHPRWIRSSRLLAPAIALLMASQHTQAAGARLKPETVYAWDSYVGAVEQRRAAESADGRRFLAMDFQPGAGADRRAVLNGQVVIRRGPAARGHAGDIDVPSGMVHHWRGAILIRGVGLPELLRELEYADPPAVQDDVLRSQVLARSPRRVRVFLRLRRQKVVTVVYNTEHVVTFTPATPQGRASSQSTATRIAEVSQPGTARERELSPGEDRGYLWKLNAYWRYEAVPGGVIAECESISLSRDVPSIAAYLAGGLIEGVARESMEKTLAAVRARYAQ